MTRPLLARLALACLLLPAAMAVRAQSMPLAVSPVVIHLEAGTDYGQIDIGNRGDAATGMEVEVVRMRWDGNAEAYEPTRDFIITPPAFRLDSGKNRLLRFRYAGVRGEDEAAYRIFIRQLPEGSTVAGGVGMVVKVGVPVFVLPRSPRPALALSAGDNPQLRNTGNVTLTVRELVGAGCPGEPFKVGQRLFPGQARSLAGRPLACVSNAQTDRGPVALAAR